VRRTSRSSRASWPSPPRAAPSQSLRRVHSRPVSGCLVSPALSLMHLRATHGRTRARARAWACARARASASADPRFAATSRLRHATPARQTSPVAPWGRPTSPVWRPVRHGLSDWLFSNVDQSMILRDEVSCARARAFSTTLCVCLRARLAPRPSGQLPRARATPPMRRAPSRRARSQPFRGRAPPSPRVRVRSPPREITPRASERQIASRSPARRRIRSAPPPAGTPPAHLTARPPAASPLPGARARRGAAASARSSRR
jgi:hypothetical protein